MYNWTPEDTLANLDAERRVLGACLVSEKAMNRILAILDTTDFYSEGYRTLFGAIKAAARDQKGKLHESMISRHLPNEQSHVLLSGIIDSLPSASNAHLYAHDVAMMSRARRVQDIAERMKFALRNEPIGEYDEIPLKAMHELEELVRDDRSSSNGGAVKFADSVESTVNWLEETQGNGGAMGLRTGIAKLDNAIGGLTQGRMYVVAGRPGSGKSLLCAQMALSVARQGKRVLLCSTEMMSGDYLRRLAVASADVDAERVSAGNFTDDEKGRIIHEAAKIASLGFFVSDRGTQTVDDIRREVIRHEPDLLVVDYLQRLMPQDRRVSRYEQVSQIAFDLDRIKKDFHVPVVAAAQLNRAVDSRADKRPVMSDLRDSGTIEQDADVIAMLYRPGHYEDEDESLLHLEVEKNRHGELVATDLRLSHSLWINDESPSPVSYA